MARVPDAEGDDEVAARIRSRRPGGVLRPIDHVLLHCPPVADGWNDLLGAIRARMGLRADLRELVILRIAVLNDAPYEWDSHQADAVAAGLSDEQIAALRGQDAAQSAALDELQRQVVRYADRMTARVDVPAELFQEVATSLDQRSLVELTITIAAYNMVSRLVVALDVEVAKQVGAA
jgi:4-carboxymuconolactone decarboxylase